MWDQLESFQNNALIYHAYLVYFIIFLTIIGIEIIEPKYMDTFNDWLKMYIALYLIYKFNSFRTIKFTELDRRVVFTSGILLLSTTILNEMFNYFSNEINTLKTFIPIPFKLSSVF